MSGGVDSSVAAHLLLRDGFEVVGVFMRHGTPPQNTTCGLSSQLPIVDTRLDHKQGCCSARDADDARRIAGELRIPFYALNLSEDFDRIVHYFVDEYVTGRTPNPCVMCNNWIKFGKLFEYADGIGADFVATGHYAQIITNNSSADGPELWRGVDQDKDQSYVLFGVDRNVLPRILLPVGGYRKSQIRKLANELGFSVASKPDSQEICFVTSGKHAEFVSERRGSRQTEGELVTTSGTVVGRHHGIERFTIGQRKGLGVALGEPYFVVRIEPERNRVVIGKREKLARSSLVASQLNWLVEPPREAQSCLAQIRYNSDAHRAKIIPVSPSRIRIDFEEPCHGVAPGQAVVCYQSQRVIGGGWIE